MLDDLPVFGIRAESERGKATLGENILPHLCERGLNVAVVKRHAQGIDSDADRPEKPAAVSSAKQTFTPFKSAMNPPTATNLFMGISPPLNS